MIKLWISALALVAIIFGVLDAIWLAWSVPNLYRPALGDILAEEFRLFAAIPFYLIYISGTVWFAVRPGIQHGVRSAALNGALLGALCYATFDLTNQVIMKTWPTYLTVIDIAWGAFATGTAATATTAILGKQR